MSVYIHGMEMPTGCLDCDFRKHDLCKLWHKVWDCAFNRHKDCPLFPVPDHGDLIDRDALRDEVKKHATPSDAWVFSFIRTAQTIIPEEPFNNLSKPFNADKEDGE